MPADLITSWFPFLTRRPSGVAAAAVVAGTGGCSDKFNIICGPEGLFFMVNHGIAEAALAVQLCNAAGLAPSGPLVRAGS